MLTTRTWGQSGQGLVEYALIIAFVVILGGILLAASPEMRESVEHVFSNATSALGVSSS